MIVPTAGPGDAVVVDRSTVFGKPPYCIHGETFCVSCGRACWLGDKTLEAVQGGARPYCLDCVRAAVAKGLLPKPPTHNLSDHLRADGPHT